MDSLKYVLGITTICDDYKELERLAEALKEIDKSLEEKQNENISVELLKNKRMYSIYETDLKEKMQLICLIQRIAFQVNLFFFIRRESHWLFLVK